MARIRTKRPPPVAIEHLRLAYDMEPKASPEAERIREINRALNKAGTDGHGATRLTAFKLRSSPIAMLLNEKKIGGEEFTAAQEIESAFMAIAGAAGFKPLSMERVDGGVRGDWSDHTIKVVNRYKAFANHWSLRKKRGDPTLSIVIMAVIDQRPFSIIEADVGMRHGKAQTVVIRALRDYAARAGWVGKHAGERWRADAGTSFKVI